jgi:hypothetical protein
MSIAPSPVRVDGQLLAARHPPPLLGEHTAAVLGGSRGGDQG